MMRRLFLFVYIYILNCSMISRLMTLGKRIKRLAQKCCIDFLLISFFLFLILHSLSFILTKVISSILKDSVRSSFPPKVKYRLFSLSLSPGIVDLLFPCTVCI